MTSRRKGRFRRAQDRAGLCRPDDVPGRAIRLRRPHPAAFHAGPASAAAAGRQRLGPSGDGRAAIAGRLLLLHLSLAEAGHVGGRHGADRLAAADPDRAVGAPDRA
ncbi:hypothetical protein G6F68_016781 [Rhizopus microsporus]|nr:hypothetical protein G6F68_016781 [Rhizopus microsporus]